MTISSLLDYVIMFCTSVKKKKMYRNIPVKILRYLETLLEISFEIYYSY